MKILRRTILILAVAVAAVSCEDLFGDLLGGGNSNENTDELVPPQNEENDPAPAPVPEMKRVSVIDYKYTNTVDEEETVHYTLTYKYDIQDRVARVEEVCVAQESYESYEIWHTFDYSIVDEVQVTSSYKSGGDDSTSDKTYNVTLSNGKATSALWLGHYESWDTYKYTFSYDNDNNLVKVTNHSIDYGSEGMNIIYENGLLTAMSWDGDTGENADSTSYDASVLYPNRYPNDKINVDLNMFLFNGGPELEDGIVSLLVSLRMCGKFGDCYAEIGGGGDEYDYATPVKIVKDPNYNEHVSVVRSMPSSALYLVKYEFDAERCPSKVSYDVVYEQFQVEYDVVAEPEPMNPKDPQEEWFYMTTNKNHTSKKIGEIKCPAVYTIIYQE